MKKYIKIAALSLAAAAVFTSCNDMESAPSNKFTDANYWTTPIRAQYVVNMAYNQMYNVGWMMTDESLSDNMFDGRSVTSQRTIRLGQATPTTSVFNDQWAQIYGGIKTCHVFMENVKRIQGLSDSEQSRMTAEIRFIRAFLYFRLTTLWGDVPFFTKDITLDEANTISRTPHSEIVAFLKKELADIEPLLPTRDQLPADENGRITRGAAAMLQARVCLMESDWNGVIANCEKLIDHQADYGHYSLFPSYAGLFEEANEYNQEVILDRGYVQKLVTWGDMLDMVPLSQGGRVADRVPQQSLIDSYIMLNGKRFDEEGSGFRQTYQYRDRDPRMTATIIYDRYDWSGNVPGAAKGITIRTAPGTGNDGYAAGGNSTQTGYYTRKWYAPQAEGTMESGLNIIMMRYADVLLMYAEAKFEKGEMNAEVWNQTVRALRSRAGFTAATALDFPAEKSTDELRQIIRNERRSELAIEGLRWFDIKRWRAGKEYLDGPVYGATFNNNRIELDNRQFDETRDYLWAVPQAQIDLNPNLAPNNPGYGN